MAHSLELSFRVFDIASGWRWELRHSQRHVLASGAESSRVRAHAKAMLAALFLIERPQSGENEPTPFIHDSDVITVH